MLGLFGTLSMANRALQTQRNGTEVAGHNLANVNTPGYSRQRVAIETSFPVPSEFGPQGTGADAVAIVQLRDALIDRQVVSETSVRGAYESKQQALQLAQAALGQLIDRQATGVEGSAAASGIGGQHGIAETLSDLFNAFQSLSTDPTSSSERQALILKAQDLATRFNQVSGGLSNLRSSLDDSLNSDVAQANSALNDLAKLNDQIIVTEAGGQGKANDLRDIRQQKIEELAKLVKIDTTANANGGVDIAVDGDINAAIGIGGGVNLHQFGQFFDLLLANVPQVVCFALAARFGDDDLVVQFGEIVERAIGLRDVAVQGVVEGGAQVGEAAGDLVEPGGEILRLQDERLPFRGGSWIGGKALKGVEQIGQGFGDAMLAADAAGGGGTFGAGGLAVDELAEGGLGQLQRLLLRFVSAAHTGLADDLPVDERVAQLHDGHGVGAGALRAEFRGDREGRFDGDALAGITWGIDIGQVMAGHFRSVALGLQRTVGHAECAEKSEHTFSLSLSAQPTASYSGGVGSACNWRSPCSLYTWVSRAGKSMPRKRCIKSTDRLRTRWFCRARCWTRWRRALFSSTNDCRSGR